MKKYVAAGIAVVIVVLAVILGLRACGGSKVDAAGYVQAQLDLTFQGETQEAHRLTGAAVSGLEQIYEDGINAFVQSYLTGGVDTGEAFSETYGKIIKKIFLAMHYQVGEAQKKDRNTYEVTVTYEPADVFTSFIPKLKEKSAEIEEKAKNGGYTGTEDEIQSAMILDYMSESYTLLESAYLDIQYGGKQEFTFTLTKEKGSKVTMDNEEIAALIEKILELDKL